MEINFQSYRQFTFTTLISMTETTVLKTQLIIVNSGVEF